MKPQSKIYKYINFVISNQYYNNRELIYKLLQHMKDKSEKMLDVYKTVNRFNNSEYKLNKFQLLIFNYCLSI